MEEDVSPTLDYASPWVITGGLLNKAQDLLVRATRKGFWPMCDQGVVSLGNFLTTIFVARGLATKEEYGLFGVLLEFMFFLNNLQGGLITYP